MIKKIVIILLIMNQYCFTFEYFQELNNFDNFFKASRRIIFDNDDSKEEKEKWEEYITCGKIAAISPTDALIADAHPYVINIWDLPMNIIVKTLCSQDDPSEKITNEVNNNFTVRAIAFSSDGQKVVIATNEPKIKIFDLKSTDIIKIFYLKINLVIDRIKFSTDDQRLYYVNQKNELYELEINQDDPRIITKTDVDFDNLWGFICSTTIETIDHRFKIDILDTESKIFKNTKILSELDIKIKQELRQKEETDKQKKRCQMHCTIL